MAAVLKIASLLLILLCGAGFYGTWFLLIKNGTAEYMAKVRDMGPRLLPGTNESIRLYYTGNEKVDHQLAVLDFFFWEQVDGSQPHASLFCYHFAGQIFAGWGLLMIESLRSGNRWRIISFLSIWGMAIQTLAYAVITPIFLILYLLTSPTATSMEVADYLIGIRESASIPLALLIGYILPSVLMSLPAPSMLNHDRKQVLIVFWQFFPVWVSVCQQGISLAMRYLKIGISTQVPIEKRSMKAMRMLYAILLLGAAANQLSALQLIVTSKIFPDLFALDYRHAFDFSKVFVPKAITASTPMDSIGSGAHMLLQYDELIGSSAMLVWAFALFVQAREVATHALHISRIVILCLLTLVLGGPLGLAVAIIWARDELVFAHAIRDSKKNN